MRFFLVPREKSLTTGVDSPFLRTFEVCVGKTGGRDLKERLREKSFLLPSRLPTRRLPEFYEGPRDFCPTDDKSDDDTQWARVSPDVS